MAEKASKGVKPKKKLILSLKDCFKRPELDGGEEAKKLWNFYREETDEESIIRRVRRDAYENQCKYLMCTQSVYYAISLHLGMGSKEVYKAGTYLCGGMGGDHMCGCLLGARLALGQAIGRDNMYTPGWPRVSGTSYLWETLPIADDELSNAFAERFGSTFCHEIQEHYFGRHFFFPSDYEDSEVWEIHESGELYRIVSVYAAALSEWTAGFTAELILRERKKLGIPLQMPIHW
jgi:hypothetical protein